MIRSTVLLSVSLLLACAAGCAAPTDDGDDVGASESDLIAGRVGAVYTLSNDVASNDVIVFRRAADGSLQRAASFATTGKGSGDGLGSQGALVLSADRRFLYAVSAGSNELAVFRVHGEKLDLLDAIATGGMRPISVTEHDGLLYVVHAGEGHNDITGFVQLPSGKLQALAGSTRALSGPTVGPAQIQFSPSGRALLVTEKGTSKVDEFRISPYSGRAYSVNFHDSNGQTPFGFAITQKGQAIVSEAFGGADNASTLSSYQLDGVSGLLTVSASVPDTESAACWVQLARGDHFAYTTNTKSGTVSSYSVGGNGALALLGAKALDLGGATAPTDTATSKNDKFLYIVESGAASIAVAAIGTDGTLTALPTITGLPATVTGLAAQ